FTKWDKEKILSDVVWVIRKFQPDVIVTRFPTTGEGGHGHHTASAILAVEAFTAAADANRFPEQLKYVQPWQVKKVLWNSFNFNNPTPPTDAFKLDVGGYNPILGKSYGEIAAESRSQHKSQGFGATRSRGEVFEYFKSLAGSTVNNDLFEDVNTTWQRINGGDKIDLMVNAIIASFDFMQPQKSVGQLMQLYKTLNAYPAHYWKEQKLKEIKDLIEAASGVWVEAFTNQYYAVQGDSLRINFVVNDRLGAGFRLNTVGFEDFDSAFNTNLAKNRNLIFNKTILVLPTKEITQPYWLKNKMAEGYYNVSDQTLIGQPDVQASFHVTYNLMVNGESLSFIKPLRYKFTDQVKGELYQPVVILPKYTIEIPRQSTIVRTAADWKEEFSYVAQKNLNNTKLYRDADLVVNDSLSLNKGGRRLYNKTMDQKQAAVQTKNGEVSYTYFEEPRKITAKQLHTIRYDHIPNINYFTEAVARFVPLEIKTAGKRIGYIVGAGDKLPESLEQMGYEVTLLTDKELARNNLKQFDAIISGVRAFNTNEWMNKYYDKLMNYVKEGGNYIVQYSQANNIRSKMGPYPFNLVSKRISDENAAVTFLKPDHQVLNFPNKITQEDFKGWIQERSLYHAGNIDSNYTTIFRMNDPGENHDDGSLIITKYGKGFFTYTGLAFFRELPAGVPGAYRLMANIIALNRKKEF
ncbi:MAG: PIG-L family deacetylase, partial [Flavisolibacter sp.]